MSEVNAHLERLKRVAAAPATEPLDADDEYAAFGSGRVGTRPQLTLVLRRAGGACHAFAYAHLYAMDYDPSEGIVLSFSHHRIVLRGRNLDDLFRFLCLHRLQTVQEVDPLHAESLPHMAPVVTGVEVAASRDWAEV